MTGHAQRTSFLWGHLRADSEPQNWWLVQMENDEPIRAMHPQGGVLEPARRDSFDRWSEQGLAPLLLVVGKLQHALAGEHTARLRVEEMLRKERALCGDAWHWLGDGNDRLEDMSDAMVVRIEAGDLRELVDAADTYAKVLREIGFMTGVAMPQIDAVTVAALLERVRSRELDRLAGRDSECELVHREIVAQMHAIANEVTEHGLCYGGPMATKLRYARDYLRAWALATRLDGQQARWPNGDERRRASMLEHRASANDRSDRFVGVIPIGHRSRGVVYCRSTGRAMVCGCSEGHGDPADAYRCANDNARALHEQLLARPDPLPWSEPIAPSSEPAVAERSALADQMLAAQPVSTPAVETAKRCPKCGGEGLVDPCCNPHCKGIWGCGCYHCHGDIAHAGMFVDGHTLAILRDLVSVGLSHYARASLDTPALPEEYEIRLAAEAIKAP